MDGTLPVQGEKSQPPEQSHHHTDVSTTKGAQEAIRTGSRPGRTSQSRPRVNKETLCLPVPHTDARGAITAASRASSEPGRSGRPMCHLPSLHHDAPEASPQATGQTKKATFTTIILPFPEAWQMLQSSKTDLIAGRLGGPVG